MGLITNETVGASIIIENGKADVKIAENTPVSITSNGLVLNVASRDNNIIRVEQGDNGSQLFAQIFDGEYKHQEYDPETQHLEMHTVDMKVAGSDLYIKVNGETVVDKKPTVKFAFYDYIGKKMYVVVDRMRLSANELKKLITRKVDYKVTNPGVDLDERDVLLAYDVAEPQLKTDLGAGGAIDEASLYRVGEMLYSEKLNMFVNGTTIESAMSIVRITEKTRESVYDANKGVIVTSVELSSNTPRIPAVLFERVVSAHSELGELIKDGDNITGLTLLTTSGKCDDRVGISAEVYFVGMGGINVVTDTYTRKPVAMVMAGVATTDTAYVAIRLADGVTDSDVTLADGWSWADLDKNVLLDNVRNDEHVYYAEYSGDINEQSDDIKAVVTGQCPQDVQNNWASDNIGVFHVFNSASAYTLHGSSDVRTVFSHELTNQL